MAALGSLVQNPPEFVTHQMFKETLEVQNELKVKFDELWLDTFNFCYDNCLERWMEEQENKE